MQFSILAFFLIAGATAAPSIERQVQNMDSPNNVKRQDASCASYSTATTFPNQIAFGDYTLCCNYFGPDPTPTGSYQNCCDQAGAGTGSGFPGCT
ncbi:hypothetical protein N0V93_007889 [Gnomoniopsis smithogilvyi]|uniref:Uncharacterized protein n=1 Tax=Gnomoniopsis smithogilvyi TaxID=1191159 RepID=A0A9W9CT80_9PEZI|nr:hypothetical protein N0V93_007889 [Gnomoniopsis smithogilvyi]